MKCSRCGYDNPEYLEYCENCAAQLESNATDGATPSWGFVKAPRWPEPDFSADNISDDDVPQDFDFEADDEGGSGLFDEPKNTAVKGQDEKLEFKPTQKRRVAQKEPEFDELDDDEYDEFDEYEEPERPARKSRSANKHKDNKILSIIILCAVIAVGLIVGIIILITAKDCNGKSGTVGTKYETGIKLNPEDTSFYHVTVVAKEGAVLVYETNNGDRSEATVTDRGVVVFNVPVDTLRPVEPVDGATYIASPKVFIKNADGTLSPVEVGSVTLDVAALDVSYSTETNITTESGSVTIAGTIVQIAATIMINDEPVTINEDGSFSHEIKFEETGTFTVNAEARMNGYQIMRQAFSVTVTAPAVVTPTIQMPWEYGDTTFSQRVKYSIDNMTVWGKAPVGSTITVSSQSTNVSFPAAPTIDGEGAFRFPVKFAVAGDFVITITCTGADGGVATRDIHVQRSPDWATYIQGSWAMNFAAFSTSSSQAYEIRGTVTEIMKNDDYILAKFQLTDGNVIVIEYHNHYGTAGNLTEGGVFNKLYGRPLGLNEEGIPQFYIWFVEG